jgi:hypothetical protein
MSVVLDKSMFKNQVVVWKEEPVKSDPTRPTIGSYIPCAICKELFQVPFYKGTMDPICGKCFVTYNETAKLVCQRCNVIVGRIVPKMLDCGFYVQPKAILHTDKCSLCDEKIKESTIVEVKEWMAKHRRPVIYTSAGQVYKPKGKK